MTVAEAPSLSEEQLKELRELLFKYFIENLSEQEFYSLTIDIKCDSCDTKELDPNQSSSLDEKTLGNLRELLFDYFTKVLTKEEFCSLSVDIKYRPRENDEELAIKNVMCTCWPTTTIIDGDPCSRILKRFDCR